MTGFTVYPAIDVRDGRVVRLAQGDYARETRYEGAPLHHHYELKGWKETQVVVRFWIITMMLVLAGLSTLKLR